MSAPQPDPDADARRRFDEREFLREAEEAAAQLERSTRTFRDVIDAAMLAGQSVELDLGSATVAGYVVSTSETLVQIREASLVRFVNLDAADAVSVGNDDVGQAPPTGVGELSLLAFLRSLLSTPPDGPVLLVMTSGRQVTGHVVGVAEDHIEVDGKDGVVRSCRLSTLAYIER